jgi:lipopolysaccharide transport system ATP-binding protein
MSDVVIRAVGLGKWYPPYSDDDVYSTLRDTLAGHARGLVNRLRGRARRQQRRDEGFWVLRDVSFEVRQGEVLGVIGRNGAGKSTLLKILSRITWPTEGYAEVRGRIGSLLEVGTGFHGELTGRENVFLNGTILGMRKNEVRRKFDEIVDFSGVEHMIDTPVKHYSTGMYLRLAFAVAAHLDPEILLVDEVLAVGDADFQRKCLRKMEYIAGEGRTILFVSHNMAAIANMCDRAIVLSNGNLATSGAPRDAIALYMDHTRELARTELTKRADRLGSGEVRIEEVWLEDPAGRLVDHAVSGEDMVIVFRYRCRRSGWVSPSAVFKFVLRDASGIDLAWCSTQFGKNSNPSPVFRGEGTVRCLLPKLPLAEGEYTITYLACGWDGDYYDTVQDAMWLRVVSGDFFGTGRAPAFPPSFYLQHSIEVIPDGNGG